MMNLAFFSFLLLPLFSYSNAHAEEGSYCPGLAALAESVKSCEQNGYFVRASNACIEKLENDIRNQQTLLSNAMLLSSATSASAQTARIENSSNDLTQMQATLSSLQAEARRVRGEIVTYSQNFALAGPISREAAEKLHMLNYVTHLHCYLDNYTQLGEAVKTIDHHIAEFEKAIQGGAKLAAINTTHIKTLDTSSANVAAHNRVPASAGTPMPVKQVPKQGPSSITGTEKIGESDRALQALEKPKP